LGGSQFTASLDKKLPRPYLNTIKNLDIVEHVCHPSYTGSISTKITVQAGPGKNLRLISKITTAKKLGV
jgi:hypothetical protein